MREENIQSKKTQIPRHLLLWSIIAAVWVFVVLKLIAGALFGKETGLVSAFSATNPALLEATVEVTARFPQEYMDSFDKKQMIQRIAENIGLTLTGEIVTEETPEGQEVSYYKEATAATTTLRIVSRQEETENATETKHYAYVKISLKESPESLQTYRKLLEETLEECRGTEITASLWLQGAYTGYLTLEKRNEITDRILRSMDAEQMYSHRETDLYTVYAYTEELDSYILVEENRLNLHIAMKQDEENYRTVLYLASPVYPDTW